MADGAGLNGTPAAAGAAAAELLVAEALRLAEGAQAEGLQLRLLGGTGVALHCRRSARTPAHREIADIDAAIPRRAGRQVSAFLAGHGYAADRRFNALHGDTRMIFHGPVAKLDLFVGSFTMCHALELDGRLGLDFPALTAADLLLTKLQIVELCAKDAQDAALLLAAHPLGDGDGDHIDVGYLARLAADDWGLWRTVTATLARVAELEPYVADRCDELIAALQAAPKTRRFRLRARVGERKRWYDLPEEVGVA